MKINKLLVLVLSLIMIFTFCACGDDDVINNNLPSSKTETIKKPTRFLVTVIDQNGDFVEGVVLRLGKTSDVTARTNNKGVATFPIVATDGYKLSVISCPKGYDYIGTPYIKMKKDTGEFTLKITKK